VSKILIAVPARRPLRWHALLRDRLAARRPDALVALAPYSDADDGLACVDHLLALERVLLRRRKPSLLDRAEASPAPQDRADIVIDLTGGRTSVDGERQLQLRYDGQAQDAAAIDALLCGDAPMLTVVDAATGQALAQGKPSLENMDGLASGLEAVYSRTIALIEKALDAPEEAIAAPGSPVERTPRAPLSFLLRNIAHRSARAIYRLCCRTPHWRVGWRFIDGPGVIETGDLGGARWRVMQNREMTFAADPFPIEREGRRGVFYERVDYRTDRGEIYFQPFDDDGPSGEPVCALREPWHLSYPFLIELEGALFMLPEASLSGAVTLYRCVGFPDRWEPVATLLDRIEAADATILQHGGRFWMTSVVRDGYGGYSDTLAIHHAESLFGPWEPHRRSPILVDPRFARPAGTITRTSAGLIRPAQDCGAGYGRALNIMRIDILDMDNFKETRIARVEPDRRWPGSNLHTINRRGRLECIDGVTMAPKFRPLHKLANAYFEPSV
jgi:hypothetical protein